MTTPRQVQPLQVGCISVPGRFCPKSGKVLWILPNGVTAEKLEHAVNHARALHYRATGREIPYPLKYRKRSHAPR